MKHKKIILFLLVLLLAFVYKLNTYQKVFVEVEDKNGEYIDGCFVVRIEEKRFNDKHINNIVIPGKVIDYKYNDDYAIVHQVYDKLYTDKFFGLSESDTLSMSEHVKDSINAKIEIYRKMKDCYWIVFFNIKKKGIIGPLSKRDFDAKCKEERIKLKFE